MAGERTENPTGAPAGATVDALIQRRLRAAGKAGHTIGPADRSRPLPLSAGQQQMWLLHQFDPTSPAYLMSWVLRFSGRLSLDGMRSAWKEVVYRHEVLRTRYAGGDRDPVQIIDAPERFGMRVVDLTGQANGARRAERIAEWVRRRPFDLTTEWPVRVTLIAIEPELHLLVVTIHHIACDAVSFQVIASEVGACYGKHQGLETAGLADVKVQYADFAAWERAARSNGRLASSLSHWRGALDGVTELALPLDRARPARPDTRGGTVDFVIDPVTADGIRALAAAHRASLFVVLLAAYHAMLSHISGSDDVTVGTPVSARTIPELDSLVGYLVNTVVVRSRHTTEQTFADLLLQVRNNLLDAFDHRAAPFKWVVDEIDPVRSPGANPLFQVGFDMEDGHGTPPRFPGLHVEQLGFADSSTAKFDLTLHINELPDRGFHARFEFAAAILDEQTVQRWAAYGETLLDAIASHPHEPLASIRERLAGAGIGGGGAGSDTAVEAAGVPVPLNAGTSHASATKSPDHNRLLGHVQRVWCEVLDVEDVGVLDNFFDVGGDSLRAVALAARLRVGGLDVSATDIFAHQTIAALVEAFGAQAAQATRPAQVASIEPFALLSPEDRAALPPDVVDAYPLAAMQLGMLIELRARPDVNNYQDSTSYLIRDTGEFDADALQQAAQLVVDRHEVLRTTFDLTGYSVPLQLVHREAILTVGIANYGVLGLDGWQPKLLEHAVRERRSLMDVSHAPLIRVFAHTAEDTSEWWITLTECHPIIEGWSFHTMLMEILTGYREIRAGRHPVEPDPVPFRYADYVAAEAAARNAPEHREFWRRMVDGKSDVSLPTAWQDSADAPCERYSHLVDLRDLDGELRRLASETRTSLKAVLLAAHLKVMSMIAGGGSFFTGLVCDARPERLGAERVLGMYLNTLPFAMPAGARTWRELVRAVYDGLTELWPHRGYPMQLIQQEFGNGGRLLEVFFNYLDFHQVDDELVDEEQTLNDNYNEFALHVFTVSGVLRFNTTTHLVSRRAAARLAAVYRTVLEEMTLDPDGEAERPCLPPGEYAEPPTIGGDRPTADDRGGILGSFTRMAAEQPDATAVRCGGRSLTYGQLEDWAAAVARRLRECDVGPGSVVGVTPERDLGTPAALLAVWMTGAAWTVLPPERNGTPSGLAADVSALVAATAAGAASVNIERVPVVVAAEERPAGRPAGAATVDRDSRLVDVACLVPVGAPGDTVVAAFSHLALADALAEPNFPGAGSWVCAAPLTTCGGLSDLLGPLASGGVVVLTEASLPESVPEITEFVTSGTVTHLRTTPLVLERVLAGCPGESVTVILCDDQPPPPAVHPQPDGPASDLIRAVPVEAFPGWVPLNGMSRQRLGAHVLDSDLRPVLTGVVGELYLSGPGTPDYLAGDAAATAERLVPDPGGAGGRLYRTRLLARLRDDWTVEPLGAGGDAVELFRTREHLRLAGSVRDSFVTARTDPGMGQRQIVGYVRAEPCMVVDDEEIRRRLGESRLPRSLAPDALVRVEHWPLTDIGTIDADGLPEPGSAAHEAAPWDERFATLLDQMTDVVGNPGIGPDMPFADAGLESFAMVRLLVTLEEEYDITIPEDLIIIDMFRTPRTLWETVVRLRAAGMPSVNV